MRSRSARRRLLVLILMGSLVTLTAVHPTPTYVCSCAPPLSVDEAHQQATAVFMGKVVGLNQHTKVAPRKTMRVTQSFPFVTFEQQWGVFTGPSQITFEVLQVWKGPAQPRITIEGVEHDGMSCGYSFEREQTYVVYAHHNGTTLENTMCGRTKLLQEAQAEVAALGEGVRSPHTAPQPSHQPAMLGLVVASAAVLLALTLCVFLHKRTSRTTAS